MERVRGADKMIILMQLAVRGTIHHVYILLWKVQSEVEYK